MASNKKEKKLLQEAMSNLAATDFLWGEALDAAFFTAIVIRLTTPNQRSAAFKLGLINQAGKILREPKTQVERRALTSLDRIVLMMKQSMGGRVAQINNMYRKRRMDPNFIRAAARSISLRFTKYYDIRNFVFERSIGGAITGGRGPAESSPGRPQ